MRTLPTTLSNKGDGDMLYKQTGLIRREDLIKLAGIEGECDITGVQLTWAGDIEVKFISDTEPTGRFEKAWVEPVLGEAPRVDLLHQPEKKEA